MLKHGEPNPLNIHGLRELDFCPPHFTPVCFDLYCAYKQANNWIWENLEGRFYFGDWYTVDDESRIHQRKCAAFELAAEASYFTLMLDTFNRYSE